MGISTLRPKTAGKPSLPHTGWLHPGSGLSGRLSGGIGCPASPLEASPGNWGFLETLSGNMVTPWLHPGNSRLGDSPNHGPKSLPVYVFAEQELTAFWLDINPTFAHFQPDTCRVAPSHRQAQSPHRAAALAAAAAARWGPASGQFQERHTHNHAHRHGGGLEHRFPSHLLSRGRRPGLQGIPRRFLITRTILAMGRKGHLRASSGLSRDSGLFARTTQLGSDVSVNRVDFPVANHRLRGRLVGRKARGLLPPPHRARTYHLKMPANSPSDYLGCTTTV